MKKIFRSPEVSILRLIKMNADQITNRVTQTHMAMVIYVKVFNVYAINIVQITVSNLIIMS